MNRFLRVIGSLAIFIVSIFLALKIPLHFSVLTAILCGFAIYVLNPCDIEAPEKLNELRKKEKEKECEHDWRRFKESELPVKCKKCGAVQESFFRD